MSGFGSFYYRDYEEPETGQKIERMEIVRVSDPIDAALDYFGKYQIPLEIFDADRKST
jgi:hypothetical protein